MIRWGYLVAVTTAMACLAAGETLAQIDYTTWNSALTGNQQWQVDGNWSPATFPNDPDRVDLDDATILNVVGANVSVGLGSNLNLSVGESDVTVAALKLGGTAGPVTTTISAGVGGRLVMENNENNHVIPSTTPPIPDTVIPAFNYSNALIVSGGVGGSTNIIAAPILISSTLDVGSYGADVTTNDLTISGPILIDSTTSTSSLNMKAAGRTLTITGDQVIDNLYTTETGLSPDLAFNQHKDSTGTLILKGSISGAGMLQIGPRPADSLRATVILEGANTVNGGVTLGLGDFILKNDNAFGTKTLRQNSDTHTLGVNLISDSDTRTIGAPVQLAQFVTIKGEHSLTITGDVAQTNSRGWINLLPAGKTLTLSGTQAADDQSPADTNPIPAGDTIYMFDGSGKTVVTGLLKDHLRDDLPENANAQRSFGVRGTGAVYLLGSIQTDPKISTYRGFTYMQGGNLHLGTVADLGSTQRIKSTGGAIGLDNGTVTGPDSAAFLAKLNSRAQATLSPQGDIVRTDNYATGGLMLHASESNANLNFTTGALANAADMTVAAPEQGMSYTGTVTPANSTYRFGGGAGVITLPNTNQLTGANSLVVMNGHDFGDHQGLGGVRITGSNNYTGTTMIRGRTMSTNQTAAATNSGVLDGGEYHGTTLTVTTLANGGSPSSIGSSSSAGSNLHIQGGTLRYEGAATSTDRLFTIGTRGATLDASGSGALTFNNTGALTIDTAEARNGVVNGFAFSFQAGVTPGSTSIAYNIADTSDLVPGMRIANQYLTESTTDNDNTITITAIQSPTRIQFSDPIGLFNGSSTPSQLTFVDVARTFTLTGTSTANNTLRPIIGDSPTNVVNVSKEGSGKWILDAVNTYTGNTSVEEGILSITKSYLADTADVMIDSGAIFDLSFVGSDTIGALFLNGASQAVGTYGSLTSSAMFKSSYFTGTGILNVTERVLTAIPGDYNNDGVVDAADYTVYRDNVGQPGGTLVNDPLGGTVGAGQYTQWKNNYGRTEAPAATSVSVPEPTALLLAAMAAIGCLSRRKAA